ncbi:MAG: hypothetical protein HY294_04095 [Candidatus Rokubacteria bacterium]|nr:hypothetical protein [Candidatus Rokubacteria bacterium]MBI3825156.1 hypothetical protein [Candidatus Rokubacteria bacterium]
MLDEEMTVGAQDERDVEPLARGIRLGLLEPVRRRQGLGFCFDQRHRDGLARGIDPHAQDVVDASASPPARATVHDLDGAGRFLAADQVFRPAARVQGRVDQLGASVRGRAERG